MIKVLEFIFSSAFHFWGTVVLIIFIGSALEGIIQINKNTNIKVDDKKKDEE